MTDVGETRPKCLVSVATVSDLNLHFIMSGEPKIALVLAMYPAGEMSKLLCLLWARFVTSCSAVLMLYDRLLEPLLQHVYHGMSDNSVDVRNAAMFALGQFSIHLQVRNHLKL